MVRSQRVSETSETVNLNQTAGQSDNGVLSLILTGKMTLKLKYEFDGEEVNEEDIVDEFRRFLDRVSAEDFAEGESEEPSSDD